MRLQTLSLARSLYPNSHAPILSSRPQVRPSSVPAIKLAVGGVVTKKSRPTRLNEHDSRLVYAAPVVV